MPEGSGAYACIQLRGPERCASCYCRAGGRGSNAAATLQGRRGRHAHRPKTHARSPAGRAAAGSVAGMRCCATWSGSWASARRPQRAPTSMPAAAASWSTPASTRASWTTMASPTLRLMPPGAAALNLMRCSVVLHLTAWLMFVLITLPNAGHCPNRTRSPACGGPRAGPGSGSGAEQRRQRKIHILTQKYMRPMHAKEILDEDECPACRVQRGLSGTRPCKMQDGVRDAVFG